MRWPLGKARARLAIYVALPVAITTPLPLPDTTEVLCTRILTHQLSCKLLACTLRLKQPQEVLAAHKLNRSEQQSILRFLKSLLQYQQLRPTMRQMLLWLRAVSLVVLRQEWRSTGRASPVIPLILKIRHQQ